MMTKYLYKPFFILLIFFTLTNCSSDSEMASIGPTTGQGGSMARFTIVDNYLYIVDDRSLKPFSIADKNDIIAKPVVNIERGIETIFPYQDKLFVGARDGMHIFDISQPGNPIKMSTYRHVTSCDPVVVNGNTAYVTLRSGNTCGGGTDVLDIIDISDPYSPKLLASYNMAGPYGLGIVDTLLFVTEGELGMKVYNARDPHQLVTLDTALDVQGFDVIPVREQNLLMVIGKDGFAQYDYSDPFNLKLLSTINVQN